ncbi:ARS-binding factor 2, mitochondrial-like [Ctenocephalides felis]|uniref:ARS-binding factor 2, mitochondrial-like n=1 Tax=Ctenocephalides felis TaxID=7515 RepID=UPI000E6E3795|nr:ARS-binding factor 2, mitochondrial-like [Ctenocephalides felis]
MNTKSIMLNFYTLFNTTQRGLIARNLGSPLFFQNADYAKKSIEEKLGYAEKPKRPLTPFFRFVGQIREQLKKENPTASTMDISKLASVKWEKAEPHVKSKLEEEYKKDQLVYIKQKVEYDKNLTEEQKEDIKQFKANQQEEKLKRDLKKQKRELGKPKKPISSFISFMKAQEPIHRGNLSFREWQVKAGELWLKLDPNVKAKILMKAKEDLDEYTKKLSEWEESMIRQGHINMVRRKALIKPPQNPSHFATRQPPKSSA